MSERVRDDSPVSLTGTVRSVISGGTSAPVASAEGPVGVAGCPEEVVPVLPAARPVGVPGGWSGAAACSPCPVPVAVLVALVFVGAGAVAVRSGPRPAEAVVLFAAGGGAVCEVVGAGGGPVGG